MDYRGRAYMFWKVQTTAVADLDGARPAPPFGRRTDAVTHGILLKCDNDREFKSMEVLYSARKCHSNSRVCKGFSVRVDAHYKFALYRTPLHCIEWHLLVIQNASKRIEFEAQKPKFPPFPCPYPLGRGTSPARTLPPRGSI